MMDGSVPPPSALPKVELDRITDDLVAQFKTVFDPEIPVDIYESSGSSIRSISMTKASSISNDVDGAGVSGGR
ncbi:MAG: hypothetical protein R3C30_12950 [Hyphomonadaceae bacterium]